LDVSSILASSGSGFIVCRNCWRSAICSTSPAGVYHTLSFRLILTLFFHRAYALGYQRVLKRQALGRNRQLRLHGRPDFGFAPTDDTVGALSGVVSACSKEEGWVQGLKPGDLVCLNRSAESAERPKKLVAHPHSGPFSKKGRVTASHPLDPARFSVPCAETSS
jgi:hypothetical protein